MRGMYCGGSGRGMVDLTIIASRAEIEGSSSPPKVEVADPFCSFAGGGRRYYPVPAVI